MPLLKIGKFLENNMAGTILRRYAVTYSDFITFIQIYGANRNDDSVLLLAFSHSCFVAALSEPPLWQSLTLGIRLRPEPRASGPCVRRSLDGLSAAATSSDRWNVIHYETITKIDPAQRKQSPAITGEAGLVLLSSVSGRGPGILIDLIFLGYFCQSIHPLDVTICPINWSRIPVNANTTTAFQEMCGYYSSIVVWSISSSRQIFIGFFMLIHLNWV